MSLPKLMGLVATFATVIVSTLVLGVSSALATTTPPGAYLWPGNAPGDTLSVVGGAIAVAVTVIAFAVYGYVALRAQYRARPVAAVHDIGERVEREQRKAA